MHGETIKNIYHTRVTWNKNTSDFCTYDHLYFPTAWHAVQQNFVSSLLYLGN